MSKAMVKSIVAKALKKPREPKDVSHAPRASSAGMKKFASRGTADLTGVHYDPPVSTSKRWAWEIAGVPLKERKG
jgi:hypothetical protein